MWYALAIAHTPVIRRVRDFARDVKNTVVLISDENKIAAEALVC